MKRRNIPFSDAPNRSKFKAERGIALVTTLLLLLLLTGISITMVLSVSSDMLVNGYYRDFRGSFYASDSGLNLARQSMLTGVTAVIPGVFDPAVPPIPTTTASTVASNVLGSYSGSNAPYSLNTGNAANSWPEKFTLTKATLAVAPGIQPVITKDAKGNNTSYTYTFVYGLTAVGQSAGTEAATLTDSGNFKISVLPGSSTTSSSFAAFGMFIDKYALCGGGDLVPGTITGPVFTNGAWNFSSAGAYEFTDQVKSANSQAGYDNGGCTASSALSANGVTPKFDAGFLMGQPTLPLPANDFNQKEAVVDGLGNQGSPLTAAQLSGALKDASGKAYPAATPPAGVFLPYSIDPVSHLATFTGGGILVEGNAAVTLSIPTTGNTTAQIYTIVQGGVTTTVTIDTAAGSSGTTTITSPLGSQTIAGVPVQRDTGSGAITRDATMLYVDGNITALTGPGSGKAGIQDTTALTVTAAGDVTVTGDVLYKTEPVTQVANQVPGQAADTLIPGSDHGQVLGIFTSTGNVNLANTQSSGNLEIDASIATISSGGSGGIVNTGAGIGTLNIVGGRIQNTIQNIGASKRNVFFDRRFASNGFSPPWFPSTTVTTSGPAPTLVNSSIQRSQWLNQTNFQ